MMKKRLVILTIFLAVFGILAASNAFATTYTFCGVTRVDGIRAPNVNVYVWAEFEKENYNGSYTKWTEKHGGRSNSAGYYSISFDFDSWWEPHGVNMWFSMPPYHDTTFPDCVRYNYKPGYYSFTGGSNAHNIGMYYKYNCPEEEPLWGNEFPEGLPVSWDNTFNKFAPDPGTGGNWANRLFGRIQHAF